MTIVGDALQKLQNDGTIRASNGGQITLLGQSRTAKLGRLQTQGGKVKLTGALDNSGQTLTLGTATGDWTFENLIVTGGAIVINPGGQPILAGREDFDGVAVTGDLTLPTNVQLRIRNGLTLNGAIQMNGLLAFQGDQTLAAGTIVFTGLNSRVSLVGNTQLTLGPDVIVHGKSAAMGYPEQSAGVQALKNYGRISADVAGGVIRINQATFENHGTLEQLNGGSIVIGP